MSEFREVKEVKDWLIKRYITIRYSEAGATAVEYGIMVALIAAVIIAVVMTLGTTLRGVFQNVVDALP